MIRAKFLDRMESTRSRMRLVVAGNVALDVRVRVLCFVDVPLKPVTIFAEIVPAAGKCCPVSRTEKRCELGSAFGNFA